MRGNGKKVTVIVLTAALLMMLPTASGRAATVVRQKFDAAKIVPTLRDAARNAQAGQMLSVVIVMAEQAPPRQIAKLRAIRPKSVRRAAVIELLKSTAGRTQADLLGVLRAAQAEGTVGDSIRPLWLSNVIVADMTPAVIEQIALRADIAYLHLESIIGEEVFPVEPTNDATDLQATNDDPIDGPVIECGVELMGAPRVWNELGFTGRGSVVCVIDTGCCITHPDLQNQIWNNPGEIPGNGIDDDNNGFIDDVVGWDFWDNDNTVDDASGHGTHVSGTVAGDGSQGQQTGMAPDAELMTCRYFVSFAGEVSIWESMQYAVDNGAHIITVSSGWPHSRNPDRATWRAECENAMAAGLAVLYAAGNEGACCGIDSVRTPGDVPDVITVGAVNCSDNIASFSSRGPVTWQDVPEYNDWPHPPGKLKPTISAPGVDTLSTSVCTGYRSLSGTSMATPHVAGAVALMLEANPELDHFQIKQILKDTAVDLGEPGPDNAYGAGRVDVYQAVLLAIEMSGPHPPRASNSNVDVPLNTPTEIELPARDDGLPDPPAAMTFIVLALPAAGDLQDVGDGHTIVPGDLPYTLIDRGNRVLYSPDQDFFGDDTLQFKANDGGEPPDGGDSGVATVTMLVQFDPPRITTDSLPEGCIDLPYGPVQFEAEQGQPELTWSAPDGLPDDLTLSPSGELSGTPTRIGNFSPLIRVTDSLGRQNEVELDLTVFRICTDNLGDLNCDGATDAFDIEPFIIAVFEPWNYPERYPDCEILRGDITRDGSVNGFDIEPFLALLFP